MQGTILDIQKFALHDGPGIRTVVFLKGCTLKCVWCCNPESIAPEPQLAYISEKCTHCFSCIEVCPQNVFEKTADCKLMVNHRECNTCGKCTPECVHDALKIYGSQADVEMVFEEVMKDKHYYENSGGGLTLSGGEALDQPEFVYNILSKAKEEGIHTCIETAGHIPNTVFQKILPLTDLFLFDYKITDPFYHRRYVGKTQELILKNLAYLDKNGAEIILRCPIIPGINNNEEHFMAITNLSNKYKNIKQVEIMPFHDYGSHKYAQLGKRPFPIESKSVEEKKAKEWLDQLLSLGCHKAKIG